MVEKKIKFTDFNGEEREETFRFNLTAAELIQFEFSQNGGMTNILDRMIETKDAPSLMKATTDLIALAYGEKSPDGRSFMKSPEISKAFECCAAYDVLFMELITDDQAASNFINALIPADLAEKVQEQQSAQKSEAGLHAIK